MLACAAAAAAAAANSALSMPGTDWRRLSGGCVCLHSTGSLRQSRLHLALQDMPASTPASVAFYSRWADTAAELAAEEEMQRGGSGEQCLAQSVSEWKRRRVSRHADAFVSVGLEQATSWSPSCILLRVHPSVSFYSINNSQWPLAFIHERATIDFIATLRSSKRTIIHIISYHKHLLWRRSTRAHSRLTWLT